jgi:Tfp pilus assembly protein PilN
MSKNRGQSNTRKQKRAFFKMLKKHPKQTMKDVMKLKEKEDARKQREDEELIRVFQKAESGKLYPF